MEYRENKKLKIKYFARLVRNRRLIKTHIKLYGDEYCRGYTDAINDILTDLWKNR